jgi:hypothetical protein
MIENRFGGENKDTIVTAIMLHELADALGRQLGYNHNTRHTAGLMIEGLLASSSPAVRGQLVALWQARPVAYGMGDIAGAKAAVAESPERRQAANAKAFGNMYERDLEVRVVVGVVSDMNMARVQPTLNKINSALAAAGFNNDREDNRQAVRFEIAVDENGGIRTDETIRNIEAALDSAYGNTKDRAKAKVVLFAPQIRGLLELANAPQITEKVRAGCDTIIIPDAYTDCSIHPDIRAALEKGQKIGTFPDIDARVALGRLIAWCGYAESKPDNLEARRMAIAALKAHLDNISDMDFTDVDDLNKLLKKLNETALRIRPVDYKEISDWKRSQEAVAVSL